MLRHGQFNKVTMFEVDLNLFISCIQKEILYVHFTGGSYNGNDNNHS